MARARIFGAAVLLATIGCGDAPTEGMASSTAAARSSSSSSLAYRPCPSSTSGMLPSRWSTHVRTAAVSEPRAR